MAAVDGTHHVQPSAHRIGLRIRLLPGRDDYRHRPRDTRLGPLPPLPAGARGIRAQARATALLLALQVRPAGSDDSAEGGPPKPPPALASVPIEVLRFGVGHRRPDGPPGTTGI